jgi:hypothetical protein
MNRTLSMLALLSLFAGASAGQSLICPASTSAGCDRLHFHVQAWSPETRTTMEIVGANDFATPESCEGARRRHEQANADAIAFLASVAPRMKTQPNRYGPCHCDMTRDPAHQLYLDDSARTLQVRTEQDLRNQLLHELIERGLPSDGEVAMSLTNQPSRLHPEAGARFRALPPAPVSRLLSDAQLMPTGVTTAPAGPTWDKDLQLAEVTLPKSDEEDQEALAEPHPFVAAEIARVRTIALETAHGDEPDKATILRATSERIRVLNKLGRIIELAGAESRLAEAATLAEENPDARHRLIESVFGSLAAIHWDPEQPADMIFDVPTAISRDPAAVMRDTATCGLDERRLALYAFLLQNPLLESDEEWLTRVAESQLPQER